MLSSRSTRSSLEIRLIRRGPVHRGDARLVEAQVHGELAAMVHEMIHHGATEHRVLEAGVDRPAGDLERPRLLELGVGRLGQGSRSEEHTSELQSQFHLVCRLLLEKKKKKKQEK